MVPLMVTLKRGVKYRAEFRTTAAGDCRVDGRRAAQRSPEPGPQMNRSIHSRSDGDLPQSDDVPDEMSVRDETAMKTGFAVLADALGLTLRHTQETAAPSTAQGGLQR